ncbi:MAG: hypothetical protein K2X86_08365 [Cytophagaceae bacterium]|nr:hypothetical protein [Cytophagaceae bacterium]
MKTIIMLLLVVSQTFSFAQFKVRESDIHFKRRIVRAVDLEREYNQKVFGKSNELVLVLLEAFEQGKIRGYKSDELKDSIAFNDFKSKITYHVNDSISETYSYRQLNHLEIGEDLIVDKNRSEIIFDMETICIFLPAEINERKILEPLVAFRYDDCMNIFKNDQRAYANSPLNNGRKLSFNEAFILRTFESYIVKIGSTDDLYFDQQFANRVDAFIATKNSENEITEYLYSLFNPK